MWAKIAAKKPEKKPETPPPEPAPQEAPKAAAAVADAPKPKPKEKPVDPHSLFTEALPSAEPAAVAPRGVWGKKTTAAPKVAEEESASPPPPPPAPKTPEPVLPRAPEPVDPSLTLAEKPVEEVKVDKKKGGKKTKAQPKDTASAPVAAAQPADTAAAPEEPQPTADAAAVDAVAQEEPSPASSTHPAAQPVEDQQPAPEPAEVPAPEEPVAEVMAPLESPPRYVPQEPHRDESPLHHPTIKPPSIGSWSAEPSPFDFGANDFQYGMNAFGRQQQQQSPTARVETPKADPLHSRLRIAHADLVKAIADRRCGSGAVVFRAPSGEPASLAQLLLREEDLARREAAFESSSQSRAAEMDRFQRTLTEQEAKLQLERRKIEDARLMVENERTSLQEQRKNVDRERTKLEGERKNFEQMRTSNIPAASPSTPAAVSNTWGYGAPERGPIATAQPHHHRIANHHAHHHAHHAHHSHHQQQHYAHHHDAYHPESYDAYYDAPREYYSRPAPPQAAYGGGYPSAGYAAGYGAPQSRPSKMPMRQQQQPAGPSRNWSEQPAYGGPQYQPQPVSRGSYNESSFGPDAGASPW